MAQSAVTAARETNTAGQKRPWTLTEINTLRTHAHLGATHLAELLNRTPKAIRQAAHRHRIPLRPPGETRGLVLGQPRGHTLPTTMRTTMLTPTTAQTVDRDARTWHTLPTCPICAARPVRPGKDACDLCTIAALTAAYEARTAVLIAQQANAAARQRRSRALRNAQNGPPSPPNPQSGPEPHPCDSRASQGPSGDSASGEVPNP